MQSVTACYSYAHVINISVRTYIFGARINSELIYRFLFTDYVGNVEFVI